MADSTQHADQQAQQQNDLLAAGMKTAGFTGVVGSNILWFLQTYVWHGVVPEQIVWTVSVIVPYVISLVSARFRVRRAQKGHQASEEPPAGATPADPPATGPQQGS